MKMCASELTCSYSAQSSCIQVADQFQWLSATFTELTSVFCTLFATLFGLISASRRNLFAAALLLSMSSTYKNDLRDFCCCWREIAIIVICVYANEFE